MRNSQRKQICFFSEESKLSSCNNQNNLKKGQPAFCFSLEQNKEWGGNIKKKQILPIYEVDVAKDQRSGFLIIPARAGWSLCFSCYTGLPCLGGKGGLPSRTLKFSNVFLSLFDLSVWFHSVL